MRGNAGQVLEEEARKAKEAAAIAAKEAAAAKASHGRSMGIESLRSLRAAESLPVGSCASGLAESQPQARQSPLGVLLVAPAIIDQVTSSCSPPVNSDLHSSYFPDAASDL